MVLHHVENIDLLFDNFFAMLNPDGYLAIADLYKEDGSFHGESFTGHKGFEPEALAEKLKNRNFRNIKSQQCFILKKSTEAGNAKEFPVFLIIASR